ncbi:MAG: CoA pyrophosphatase [Hyphomicrobiales bacterium]|nr:CoA pyrophosphatase [Hyphomicrobiales bacterium]
MAANLAAFEPVPCDDGSLRRAAVAVTVVRGEGGDGQAAVLLTRRSRHLRRHGGQFALPGGRLDPGETAPRAALRELHEELGLDLDAGAILGRLDDYPTRSGFRVTPLVVWGGAAADLRPDPDEVARVFRVPMAELDSPAVPRLRVEVEGRRPALMAPLPSVGGEVHSPTAAMLYQFREVALRGQATRVAHFEQSEFAWK